MKKKFEGQLKWPLFSFVLGVLSGLVIFAGLYFSSPFNFDRPKTATLHTSLGNITIKLSAKAPKSVAHFVQLVKAGFYDGTRIHRVVPQFLIQGGDPLTKNVNLKNLWGNGGPGFVVADEITANEKFTRGTVALAKQGPDTHGSQFFILVADKAEWLEGQHTIIGHVISGIETADEISRQSLTILGIPQNDVIVKKITLD